MSVVVKIRFLRNILLLSFAIAVVLPVSNVLFIAPALTQLLMKDIEEEAVNVANHLRNELIPGDMELTKDSLPADVLSSTGKDFKVMKMKAYVLSGEVLYSTDQREIGSINKERYFHEHVAAGKTYTKIVRKGGDSLEGRKMATDAVEVYIPVMKNGRFLGAFEIYYDITDRREAVDKLLLSSSIMLFSVASGLLVIVVVILSKAAGSITERGEMAEELRKSERQYRVLFENNPHPMWVYDLETLSFLAVNDAAVHKYGYSREEFLAMTIKDIRPPEDVPALLENMSRGAEGLDAAGVWRHRKKDGTVMYVEITSHTLNFAGKRAKLVLGMDVTERKQAEEALKQTTQTLQSLIQASPLAITVVNPEGIVMMWNPAAERIFGWSADEATGRFNPIVPEGKEDEFLLLRQRVLQGESFTGVELRRQKKDGFLIDISLSAAPLRDFKEDIIGIIGIIADITEHKQAENALRAAIRRAEDERAKSEGIIAAVGDGLSIQDTDFKILYQNQTHKDIVGDHVGEYCYMAYEKREQTCEGCPVAMSFRDGKIHRAERSAPTDKGIIHVDITTSPLNDATGKIIAGIEIVRDITGRKKMEEQIRASLKEKEILLKEIHHRVKNNLQIISSMLSLQSGYIKDGEDLELFNESRNRIKAMALIHEKLYHSKDLARVNVAEYIRTLTDELFRAYRGSASLITLKTDIEDVLFDIDRAIPCGLIINELVSNSLKYAFPSGREGEISITLHSDIDGTLTLSVRDNGIGLPEDIGIPGAPSLGLQLVKTLTEQLDGTIELDRNSGTSFTISFKGKE